MPCTISVTQELRSQLAPTSLIRMKHKKPMYNQMNAGARRKCLATNPNRTFGIFTLLGEVKCSSRIKKLAS